MGNTCFWIGPEACSIGGHSYLIVQCWSNPMAQKSQALRRGGELQLLCRMCCQAAFELFMSLPID